jgi:hypothetical protein
MAKKKKLTSNQLGKLRAKIKYAPERDTITALVQQAGTTYGSDVADSDTTAGSTIRFAKGQRKPTRKVFDQAKSDADNAATDVKVAFGNLGGAADPYRAVTAREQGGREGRLALARSDALHELTDRQLDAKAGRQFGHLLAQKTYNTSISDLATRLRSLDDKQGAFAVEQAASLDREGADRRSKTRATNRKISSDEKIAANKITSDQKIAAEKIAAAGPKKVKGLPKGVKRASREELNTFESSFAKALSYAKQLSPDYSAAAARDVLTKGSPASKDAAGNVLAAVPSIPHRLALQAAIDIAYGTHLSGRTVKRLHSKGIRLTDVPGLTSKPSKRLGHRRPGSGVGQLGV